MNRFFVLMFVIGLQLLHSQSISSLNDSIRKYTIKDPEKALDFGYRAISTSDFNKLSWDVYDTNYLIGQTLYYINFEKESFDYLFQALRVFESLPVEQRLFKKITKPPWILVTLGNSYLNYGDFERARNFYFEAIENFELYEEKHNEDKFFGLNTVEGNLAMISYTLGDFEESLQYYKKILTRRQLIDKPSDIIKSYTQFINLYLLQDNTEDALTYLDLSKSVFEKESLEPSFSSDSEIQLNYSEAISTYADYLKNKQRFSESLAMFMQAKTLAKSFINEIPGLNVSIAECHIGLKNFTLAKSILENNIGSIFNRHSEQFIKGDSRIRNFQLLADTYQNLGEFDQLLSIKDSIIYYSKQSQIDPYKSLDNVENIILLSEKQAEINESEIRYNRAQLLFSGFALILILLVVILRINNHLQRERSTRLELERNRMEEELNAKKRELFSKTNFIIQRNEYLQNFRKSLGDDKELPATCVNRMKREISSLINSESAYSEFDKKFVEVFPDFYKKLNENYKLSKVDLRLIAYIKMNKSNNEIAQISGISLRTVQSQRYRLAKKLSIDKNQDLNAFIFSI
jgi:DNA-binding CsgD family transcriptional regulator